MGLVDKFTTFTRETIFERINGISTLQQAVRQCYREIYVQPVIEHHFTEMDPEVVIDH
jgi:hypothetical protein